jgi:ketosteroid isomerase-like protein
VAAAVEIVTELFRRFQAGEDPFPLLDEDIEWTVEMLDTPQGESRGHRGVAEFFRRWLGTWDQYEMKLEEVREAPDGRVVALFRERATGRGSGVPVEMSPGAVIEIRDDKVVSYRGHADREDALREVGLV